jgi:hypothetical protein
MAKESTTGTGGTGTAFGSAFGADNPWFQTFNPNSEATREFWGTQMKNSQALFDQSMKLGQAWAEFSYGQAQEAAKFSHEAWKQSAQAMEAMSKTAWGSFERFGK